MIKAEKGKMILNGSNVHLMTEFRAISKAMRNHFVEELGEEHGNKMFDALVANSSNEKFSKEVEDILDDFLSKKIDESSGFDALLALVDMVAGRMKEDN